MSIALARAGWNPIPQAITNSPSARIERFGADPQTFFTVRNLSDQPLKVDVKMKGLYPGLSEFRNRVPLNPTVDQAAGETAVSFTIPANELIALRAEPAPKPPQRSWPQVGFLAEAAPVSVIAPDTTDTLHVAHCVKGFVELQGELLNKTTETEIVSDAAKAKFPNRVLVKLAPEPSLAAEGPNAVALSGPNESSMRQLLGEYLETIERPLTNEPAKCTLAAPER
ncbi:MAG: hypothetical protein NTW86_07350 [Candidatus Sumerlaeota bacterium]|nr:hypothetical protein [Candidatus Sumerlaeota bacterium]